VKGKNDNGKQGNGKTATGKWATKNGPVGKKATQSNCPEETATVL